MVFRMETSAVIYVSVAAKSKMEAVEKAEAVIEKYGAGLSIPIDTDETNLDMRAYFQNDSGAPPDIVEVCDRTPTPTSQNGGAA